MSADLALPSRIISDSTLPVPGPWVMPQQESLLAQSLAGEESRRGAAWKHLPRADVDTLDSLDLTDQRATPVGDGQETSLLRLCLGVLGLEDG